MGGDEVLPFLAGLGKSEQRERSEQKKFDTVFFRSYSSFSLYDTIRPYSNLLARILNPYSTGRERMEQPEVRGSCTTDACLDRQCSSIMIVAE